MPNKFNPDLHHRRSVRLRHYNYTNAGAYFVTICVQNRECLFGDVVDDEMRLNDAGKMVQSVWDELPSKYPGVEIDQFIVMPNHVHGIVVLVGAGLALPSNSGAASSAPTLGLGDVIRTFKSISAIAVNRLLARSGRPLWQRNYYEHIIRNDEDLGDIREYIAHNPAGWIDDDNHPDAASRQTNQS